MGSIMIFIMKYKMLVYSIVAAYVAATMKYVKMKREGRKPTLSGVLMFGFTASLVTYSVMNLLKYLMPDLPEGIIWVSMFWTGYMSDYFYSWIPNYIKEKLLSKLSGGDKNKTI